MFIGHSHRLRIIRADANSLWLDTRSALHHPDADTPKSLPLSRREAPEAAVGDTLSVFIRTEADGSPLATTQRPYVMLGQCATLKVSSVGDAGAFLDWGLDKELLLPFAEQRRPVELGGNETVVVILDKQQRLTASSRIDHHLSDTPDGFRNWQAVDLLVYQRTDIGFKAVVEDRAIGLIYKDDVFRTVKVGTRLEGYVKRVREDGRLDLSLQAPARTLKHDLADRILADLQQGNGESTLTDASSPEDIKAAYQVSKKNYKRALSTLYKQRRIRIEDDRIVLVHD